MLRRVMLAFDALTECRLHKNLELTRLSRETLSTSQSF
jgi:hypothetical protein